MLRYQPRLLIQTRGPLVVRDCDILRGFEAVRLNMSIPTDSERVRATFEPKAPPLEARWEAIHTARAAGIPIGICVTPMLPLQNVAHFVDRLCQFNPEVLVTQDFHTSQGGFGADTGAKAREILRECPWGPEEYQHCRGMLRERREVFEGEAGFFPPSTESTRSANAYRA
jgi:DNA repair photolyase